MEPDRDLDGDLRVGEKEEGAGGQGGSVKGSRLTILGDEEGRGRRGWEVE